MNRWRAVSNIYGEACSEKQYLKHKMFTMFHFVLFFFSSCPLYRLPLLASFASPWLSKIGQVKRDSGASLIQFDKTAGC